MTTRGVVRYKMSDINGTLRDFGEAIRLKPNFAGPWYDRGNARRAMGDGTSIKAAIADFENTPVWAAAFAAAQCRAAYLANTFSKLSAS